MVSRRNRSEEYKQAITPFIDEWAERVADPWQQFRNWSVQQVLWDYGLSFADVEEATNIDGPKDKGIDAWYYDEADIPPRLILVQAKDRQIERADFSKLKDGFLDVVLPDRPGQANQSLREKAATFRDAMPPHFRLDVYLTSSYIAQQGLQPSVDGEPLYGEILQVGENAEAEASYYVRDIKFMAEHLQVIHLNPISTQFHVEKNSFFEFAVGGHTRTVCAALKATELARLFDRERENLFRKNPRYYLLSSARNKDIKAALNEMPNDDFFVYNNGLTCIAESIRAIQHERECVIDVSNFQIVNGCQTVASIWSTWADGRPDLSEVRVLAKIVENPRTDAVDDRMSGKIAERSNTQNPIKAEDWKANDDRQERWREGFRRLPEPWYYEIKRGVWATEYKTTEQRAPYRIGQTTQYRKVSMKDLGQACYAFIGHPAEAQDKAREIFNIDTIYERVFSPELTPRQLQLPYLIWQEADAKTKRRNPTYTLQDADGFSVKTEHLRFPIVNAIGSMLSTLAGRPRGYFPASESEKLIQTRSVWMPLLLDAAFDRLAHKLATESRNSGIGPRSIVRRNEWMLDPIEVATTIIRQRLSMETEMGRTGEDSLTSALPFAVR